MKKLFFVIIGILCLILCLCACNFKHEHTPGEWKYSESEHWRLPECDRENCAVPDVVYDYGPHVDQNADGACDVCGYAKVSQCPYCGDLAGGNRWFIAKVVSENGVKPLGTDCFEAKAAGSAEIRFNSSDGTLAEGGFAVGDVVCITYGGYIMESYPVQISPISVERADQFDTQ